MCVVPDSQRLYVYGGVVVPQQRADAADAVATTTTTATKSYGGFYMYDISQNKWTVLREDGDLDRGIALFYGREGASLCLHPDGQLYVVGGQRHGVWHTEGLVYDPATDSFSNIARPNGGIYLAAAAISEQRGELYVFGGMMKSNDLAAAAGSTITVETNSVRYYTAGHDVWTELPVAPQQADSSQYPAPSPRYSTSLCYDPETRALYVFGGASSSSAAQTFLTLGDLWIGRLRPAPRSTLLARIRILLRTLRCSELCVVAPQAAEIYYDEMLRPLCSPDRLIAVPRLELMSRARVYRDILALLPRSCFMQPQGLFRLICLRSSILFYHNRETRSDAASRKL